MCPYSFHRSSICRLLIFFVPTTSSDGWRWSRRGCRRRRVASLSTTFVKSEGFVISLYLRIIHANSLLDCGIRGQAVETVMSRTGSVKPQFLSLIL